ncbi:MAG: 4'-phosphopantetheinyl transferase superfamily protein [Alphaproteobacteria bacterium]|nr:MAG: 4'-phosphopantetheinyl transferase superfamily protein [Alphaproteobacteria bacterium]
MSLKKVTFAVRAADPALDGQDILSASEHARLASMHEGARPAFVTARSMLRARLGDYMGLLPGAVPLLQEGAGRVHIEGFSDDEPPFFSVSHTGSAEDGIAAVVVSEASPVGIDIQQVDHAVDWRRVAERRFPPEDVLLLSAMPEEEGRLLFFTLWAIRESFVKMEDGKLMPYLRQIELDLAASPPRLIAPTLAGLADAMIWFHYVPEHQLVAAFVSARPVELDFDCEIVKASRRPDPLSNRAE